MTGWWTVEIDTGGLNWKPVAYCVNEHHAALVSKACREVGLPARLIEPNTTDGKPW